MDATDELRSGLESLRANEDFTDLSIICGLKTYKTHKSLVCAQSEYFRKVCNNPSFRAPQVTVNLGRMDAHGSYLHKVAEEHDDEEAVKQMIDFFYTLDDPTPEHGDFPLTAYAQLFAIAVKYHVPGLRKIAVSGFNAVSDGLCNGHGDTTDFAQAIKVIYATTRSDVQELREIVEALLEAETELLDDDLVEEAVSSVPGLAYRLLLNARRRSKKPVRCPQRSQEL
ncbi:hypothetical protein LTR56_015207 [Elasticomyces elasticus]|nr:hypothetical protein LTR56_015207 [Elasticomyces elasticus]KAK3644501.1 hypothetical protein LTR22_015221 [Elasticomyces elasticus]KAK4915538.1 hypothetical protein LTR49_016385 [Elasticomyces elasticus]KAK5756255.1 hypothetical protein LTS12_013679 [Elasticomyces elasticus]